MEKLLALIEMELKKVDTTVICPICGKKQSFELDELSIIRLGRESAYTATGGVPTVQCRHCKVEDETVLIRLNEKFYEKIQSVVLDAILSQPPKYIDADYKETYICVSE